MIWAVLSLALAWTLGYLLVEACWPPVPAGHRQTALKLWLGVGCGFGIVSLLQMLTLIILGRPVRGGMVVELLLAACLLLLNRRRQTGGASEPSARPEGGPSGPRTLRLLGLVVVGAAALRLAYVLGLNPHGSWDAFAIWNVRARFLYRLAESWPTAFDARIAHADYPLLLPSVVLRGWVYAGREHMFVPMSIAVGFIAAIVGLLHGTLAAVRGEAHAWLGVLVAVGAPFLVTHTASQTADVPLAFYVLATVVVLVLHDAARAPGPGLLLLAGFMAGCAAWTKNEGLLFVLAIGAGRFAVVLRDRGLRGTLGQLGYCALGALPVLGVLVYFKLRLAPPNDLVTADTLRLALRNLGTPLRFGDLLRALGVYCLNLQTSVLTAVPLLIAYLAIAGRSMPGPDRTGALTAAVTLAGVLVGYLLVYLAFSSNVSLHVQTSFDRLMLHFWPAAVLTYFLYVRAPAAAHET